MKKVIYSLILFSVLLIFSELKAQTFQKEYTSTNPGKISGIETVNSGNYLYSTSEGGLNLIDGNGIPVWYKHIPQLTLTSNYNNYFPFNGASEPIIVTNNRELILGGQTIPGLLDSLDFGTIAWVNFSGAVNPITNDLLYVRRNSGGSLLP